MPYDIDLGPVLLGDYYHRSYFDVLEDVAGPSPDFKVYVPASDNSLINGKNNYNCSMATGNATCRENAGLAKFKFTSGMTHRLRLMNTGAAALIHFSIDGHSLQVIATDFTPVETYETQFVTLGVAQRTDVLVRATGQPTDTFWMRSTISLNCSVTTTPTALGVVLYESAEESAQPNSTAHTAVVAADQKSFLCQNVSSSLLHSPSSAAAHSHRILYRTHCQYILLKRIRVQTPPLRLKWIC